MPITYYFSLRATQENICSSCFKNLTKKPQINMPLFLLHNELKVEKSVIRNVYSDKNQRFLKKNPIIQDPLL